MMTSSAGIRRRISWFVVFALWIAIAAIHSSARGLQHGALDSDHDGLSDRLEQNLLEQFAPRFVIGQGDCSNRPAEFDQGISRPEVKAENGTIYGQVFPNQDLIDGAPAAEIHYYHLWRLDCGRHGHLLDAEHVSVLVQATARDVESASWRALYWYAAAHEDTVCDVSQIARASALHAEESGATIWVSPGKHASYLAARLCREGCGADRCEKMAALDRAQLVNLGEPGHTMNGSVFTTSSAWPLGAKMAASNFPPAILARISNLPDADIEWFKAGRHPSQGIIAISSTTEQAIAGSGRAAISGLSTAADATGGGLSTAQGSSGNALEKSYRKTVHALGAAFRHIGQALQPEREPDGAASEQ